MQAQALYKKSSNLLASASSYKVFEASSGIVLATKRSPETLIPASIKVSSKARIVRSLF
jgi:hypothetical protein